MKARYDLYAAIRDDNDYTDYRVAKETGIGAATLSDWKNGVTVPKADKLFLIANLFGVAIERFFQEG